MSERGDYVGRAAVPLSLPSDAENLSKSLCILRDQIEIFAATSDDVAARKRHPPKLGAVGLRCRHCYHLPLTSRSKGSVSYPKSISLIHQTIRNFHRFHFHQCKFIPEANKEAMKAIGKNKQPSKKGSDVYWIQSSKEQLGMVDEDDGSGGSCIRFSENSPVYALVGEHESSTIGGNGKNNAMWAPTAAVANECISTTIDEGVILNANGEDILELFSDEALENDLAAIQEVIGVEKNADGASSKIAGCIEDERESDEKKPSAAAMAPDDKAEKKKMGAMTKDKKRSSLVSLTDSIQSFELDSNDVSHLLDILGVEAPGIATAAKSQNSSSLCSAATATTGASTAGTRTHSKTFENDGGNSSEQFSATEQKLLDDVHFLFSTVRQTMATLPTDDSTASLAELGKTVYSILTGTEFIDAVLVDGGGGASSTDDNVDAVVESLSKTDFDEQDQQKKRLRPVSVHIGRERSQPSTFDILCESTNLPSQLCFLLSGLLASHGRNGADEEGQAEVYASLEDVESDLREMLDDPKRYLFDVPPGKQSGKLTFDPLKLYGREIQIEELTDIIERVVLSNGSQEVVVVSGSAGSGKTALVDKLLHQCLYPSGGCLIRAKFQQLGQIQPISVVLQAFDEFCQDILNAGDDDLSARLVRTSIADAVGTDGCRVLSSLMPSIGPMLGMASSSSPESATEGHAVFNRSLYYLRQFIKAIGSPSHPVVLLFDDLQWVDQICLDLIITLLTDDFTSLLLVGCCREDEVESDPDHPLRGFRLKMMENGVPVSDVVLGDLTMGDLNFLVADLLHSSPRATEQLSRTIYAKTGGGNPLFVKQFILSLYEDRSLTYSPVAGRWVWTMKDIGAREVSSNVVGILTSKIRRLDEKSQTVLKVAACLGSQFRGYLLGKIRLDGISGLMEQERHLQILVNEGLLCKLGDHSYKFAHDEIFTASYSLIACVESMHLDIARALLANTPSPAELKDISFVVVDQFSRGISLVTDHTESIRIAEVCLTAGKKALSQSAFSPASIYLSQGCALLTDRDWEGAHYKLCLNLCQKCIEAQYVVGNHEGVLSSITPVLMNGRTIMDKIPSIFTYIQSLGGQGRYELAIETGLDILPQLGVELPKHPQQSDLIQGYLKTQLMLQGKAVKHWFSSIGSSDWMHLNNTMSKAVSEAPAMNDPVKEAAVHLLLLICRFALLGREKLAPMACFLSVQIALTHGPCRDSAFSFASFGAIKCMRGDYVSGERFGHLALLIRERFGEDADIPAAFAIAYSSIFSNTQPLQSVIPPLQRGYQAGRMTGRIEMGFTCARLVALRHLNCGTRLDIAALEVETYVREMRASGHHTLYLTMPCLQAMLNLMDEESADPSTLNGKIMTEDGFVLTLGSLKTGSIANFTLAFHFLRMQLAYLFCDFVKAGTIAIELVELTKERQLRAHSAADETLYLGLVAVLMAAAAAPTSSGGAGGDAKESNASSIDWQAIVYKSLDDLSLRRKHSTWNFESKVCLLSAEISFYLKKDNSKAGHLYDEAIKAAEEHKFINECALASERASYFYLQSGDHATAQKYLDRAAKFYRKWGASRKVAAITGTMYRPVPLPVLGLYEVAKTYL